ncbi:MAG: ABC transporter ATP-binding protein [Rhodothermia bacterium]|nr:ABC transporter ATP-binding protein [Rhodothermia bacterium]
MDGGEPHLVSRNTPLVQVIDLTKTYGGAGDGRLLVLDSVNLTIGRGEIVAVTGESGSGKSTLLHLLGALDRPDTGEVLYEGKNVFGKTDEQLSEFRGSSVGFVFQFHHLLPEFNAVENVAMPAIIRQQSFAAVRSRALDLLEMLGIADRASHRPSALSGGEQQRVAVARALMNNPALVLADEPTGNLDSDTAGRLQDEILRLSRELNQTFVLATHSNALASRADRTLRLRNHKVEPVT